MSSPPDTAVLPLTAADQLGRWLDTGDSLAAEFGDEPPHPLTGALFRLVLANTAVSRGDEDGARKHLAEVRRLVRLAAAEGTDSRLVEVRHDVVLGRQAIRRGALLDVDSYSQSVERRLARLPDAPASVRLAALELRVQVAMMRGAYVRAHELLTSAAELAVDGGDIWVARHQRLLGALCARQGRPSLAAHHYRLAVDRLSDTENPAEVAKLNSNLAMVALMGGDAATAEVAVERALQLRRALGAPHAELANSTCVRALVADRLGRPHAGDAWNEAVALARRSGDAVLAAEIELRASMNAADSGARARAADLLEAASASARQVSRLEPTLGAMLAEAKARLALADDRTEDALVNARAARDAFAQIDATYHVARLDLLLSRVEHRLGLATNAVERLGAACRAAVRDGFELAWRPSELELLREAARSGDRRIAAYCAARDVSLPFTSKLDAGIVLHFKEGSIEVDGTVHALGTRSVVFRLAKLLATAPPEGLTGAELCRRLWRKERDAGRTANRLKVHLHRLRTLLGPDRHPVLTRVPPPGSRSATSYRWNPDVPTRVADGASI